jgi:hypothetical protein
MHQLATAIASARELLTPREETEVSVRLKSINELLIGVSERLSSHNQVEELTVYQWITLILDEREQAGLSTQIHKQLGNRPARFTADSWRGV